MFKTLDDLKDKNKKDTKKVTNSYAGGEASGLAIENPDDRKNVQEILTQAQLGSEKREQKGKEVPKTNCKITLYSNGFMVNDGEFRDYSRQENRQFLADLKQERVPAELRKQFPEGLYVGLDDRTSEAYVPPPPPSYVSFSGQGVSLGGPAVQTQQQPKIQLAQSGSTGIPFDANKPTTTVVVRLFDGQTLTLTVNLTTQVVAIYNHVKSIVNPGSRTLNLIAGFPPRPITNLNQTVEDADLADSEIRQTFG